MPTQIALPIQDVSSNGWGSSPIACRLDGGASGASAPCGSQFELKIAPALSPCGGPQVLVVRLKGSSANALAYVVFLQGSSVIAVRTFALSHRLDARAYD